MIRQATRTALLSLAMLCPALTSADCTDDAMIVFDGSGSMAEMGFNQIDEPRIFEARRAMARSIPQIAAERRLGLLVYGPGGADGCSGLDLRFPPMPEAASTILDAVNALQPGGDTPLTEAVRQATDVLREISGGGDVVLVTDGKETCGGATCQLAAALSDGPVTVHVIGFKIRGEHFVWDAQPRNDYSDAETVARCLADRTGGHYASTETVEELVAALTVTLGCRVLF